MKGNKPMAHKIVTRTTIVTNKEGKDLDLFEKGRLVHALLSDTLPFGFLMNCVTNQIKTYKATEEEIKNFITDTVKDVKEELKNTNSEEFVLEDVDFSTTKVDKNRFALTVSSILSPAEELATA